MRRINWGAAVVSSVLIISLLSGCGQLGQLAKFPKPQVAMSSKVYDAKGKEIASLYEENRVPVKLAQVSPFLVKAVIAVEDSRFYEHKGIDPVGIARALLRDIRAGEVVEGGSTITQQTAKNLYLSHERTWQRKVKEAILTVQLEQKYTKDEILEMYLNQIYFGHGAYGVEVAAQTYFGKSAKELNLAESALLAGLPKGPNYYSPFRNYSAAKERQAVVLNRMVEVGQISREEADKAKQQPIVLTTSNKVKKIKAPFFVDEVREYITEKYENGAELLLRGGLSVYTTLDLEMQEAAEEALVQGLTGAGNDLQGALVAIEPQTGYIKAMVGGKDFQTSKFNRTLALRQPGSAFKPFLYAAAIEAKGLTAGTAISCEPVSFRLQDGSNYTPADYGKQPYHYRNFTLTEALVKSDNVVSVKLNQQVGPQTLVNYAQKLGITSKLRPYLSLVLGTSEVTPLEMASAYGAFANQGLVAKPLYVLKIVDKDGRVLEENTVQLNAALDPKTAYIVTDMLRGVLQPGGTAGSLAALIGRPAAGKTGTTQEYRDAWFVGYTPELSSAIYVGYDKPKSTGRTGGDLAAPIWGKFVKKALEKVEPKDFVQPADTVKVKICADSGLLATPFSERVFEVSFVKGTEPTTECPAHSAPWPFGEWFWGGGQETAPTSP
ncbi:MAG: penicillin-binding protein 1A [Clostridia bacterium]|nr:penicillin-binding protein 1A [Clostridia bacterium]